MGCFRVQGSVRRGVSPCVPFAPFAPLPVLPPTPFPCSHTNNCVPVLRYEIEHPVVNDGGMTLWRQLGVSSWPTLAVVSPSGRLIAMLAGEGHRQDLDDIVTAALEVGTPCCCDVPWLLGITMQICVRGDGNCGRGQPSRASLKRPCHAPLRYYGVQYYGEQGVLDDTPVPVSLERERDPRLAASPLRFPGAPRRGCCGAGADG